MDMFDFNQVIDLMKIEPGHGLLQSILLFMIWLQSRGLRKEMASFKESLTETRLQIEARFGKIELRLNNLEGVAK